MKEVMKATVSDYREFIKENRWVPWIVIASVLLSYGITLSGVRIGIDAETNMNDAATFLDSWYSIGRFSLVFLKNLTGLRELNPMLANILMLVTMGTYGLFADFLFFVFSGKSKSLRLFYMAFPALFLTHPCFVQQYVFSVQAFEVAFFILVCLAAVYLISLWVLYNTRNTWIPGLVLMVISFGAYQAIVAFYIAAALAIYLIYYYFHENKEPFFYLKAAVKYVLSFAAGYLVYNLCVRLVLLWQEGKGFQGEYLEGQLYWNRLSFETCIGSIKYYIRQVLFGDSVFYTRTFFFFALIFAVHLIYGWIKKRRREYLLYAAAAFLLVLSPFYLSLYQGGVILMRTQLALPFTAAFFGAACAGLVFAERRYLSAIAASVCIYFAINQGTTASRALFSAQMTYEHDKIVAQCLLTRMQALGVKQQEEQRVAMVGKYYPLMPEGAGIREETVGYSFFEWDAASDVGVSKRGTGFLTALGFPLNPATPEEYQQALVYSAGMPVWPAEGSVAKMGDVIVVKFSE